MINSQQLEFMSQQSIDKINKNNLVDISAINIKEELPQQEKALLYLEQVKNPYCFLCRETTVRVCFTTHGPDLGQLLANFFIHLKQG